jgi:hypothetical protein
MGFVITQCCTDFISHNDKPHCSYLNEKSLRSAFRLFAKELAGMYHKDIISAKTAGLKRSVGMCNRRDSREKEKMDTFVKKIFVRKKNG